MPGPALQSICVTYDFKSGQFPIGMHNVCSPSFIHKTKLINKGVTVSMGERSNDPLPQERINFIWSHHRQTA